MNNLVKKIIIGGMVVAGTGLMADAYLRTDGKMDKGAKVEHLGGLSLILGGFASSAYKPKNTYKIQ